MAVPFVPSVGTRGHEDVSGRLLLHEGLHVVHRGLEGDAGHDQSELPAGARSGTRARWSLAGWSSRGLGLVLGGHGGRSAVLLFLLSLLVLVLALLTSVFVLLVFVLLDLLGHLLRGWRSGRFGFGCRRLFACFGLLRCGLACFSGGDAGLWRGLDLAEEDGEIQWLPSELLFWKIAEIATNAVLEFDDGTTMRRASKLIINLNSDNKEFHS